MQFNKLIHKIKYEEDYENTIIRFFSKYKLNIIRKNSINNIN
jgi:hypothetical protein